MAQIHERKAGGHVAMERRVWRKPELVVLVRNKPEESVLVACKAQGFPGGSSIEQSSSCKHTTFACNLCSARYGT